MIIVLDTETTGLPKMYGFNKFKNAREIENYDSSRVIQIAIGCYNSEGKEEEFYDILINPDNKFEIKNSHFHGITQEKASNEGILFSDSLTLLNSILEKSDVIIGHNIQFDIHVLASELYRIGEIKLASTLLKKKNYCTCYNGKNITKIKTKYNKYKLPTLEELYTYLYKEPMINYHNAKYDVIHTAKCYFKMIS
jgi:DNA polymerase-3 subunit alpha